jgi:uroporphyrinogen III methyltransferase/synthase
MKEEQGKVYIVGAGPGDAGLITQRALHILQKADVVVYDNLVNDELLQHCPPQSEKIYVGKMAGSHTMRQEEINRLLIEKAREEKTVVRLKGGDPYIFGRGGEEALELAASGLEFEIVPGVTAAVAAAAYAGIPLTQRGMCSSVSLITGHEDPDKAESHIHWEHISPGTGTLVFYMGVKNLPGIVSQLMHHGRPGSTPAALIRWGTLNNQETLAASLETIASKALDAGFLPPAILVVGEVVTLREKLRWFDKRPLFGKRILVTRSRSQASELCSKLKALGADAVEFPTIRITTMDDYSSLEDTIGQLADFSWILFSSVNGVDIFFERLLKMGLDSRALKGVKVAVMGAQTAARLRGFGVHADLVPERYTSEGVLEAFGSRHEKLQGKRILFPGSEIARDVLPEGLRKMGAEVAVVPVYRNLIPQYTDEKLDELFDSPSELITFTSSSTVINLASILREHGRESLLKSISGASIGPVTTSTAEELGIKVVTEASPHTVQALVDAILDYCKRKDKA